MTKLFSTTISLTIAVVGLAASVAPTQAATRLMNSTVDGFEYRCERYGGVFSKAGALVECQTPTVPVSCEYFDVRQAVCAWPGIANQVHVVRVIGTLPSGYTASLSDDDTSAIKELPDNDTPDNGGGGGLMGPQDIQDAPDSDPKPNFNGPNNIQANF